MWMTVCALCVLVPACDTRLGKEVSGSVGGSLEVSKEQLQGLLRSLANNEEFLTLLQSRLAEQQ